MRIISVSRGFVGGARFDIEFSTEELRRLRCGDGGEIMERLERVLASGASMLDIEPQAGAGA